MSQVFADSINNNPFYATRAEQDQNGLNIDQTYAKKSELPTVNDGTLTIQKNGTTVDTFTANSSSNKTVNIEVPTKTSDLTNDSGFITASDIPAQVQSNWDETDTSSPSYIQNKPTINNVPAVGSSDDGKVLTASYSGGVGSYSWQTSSGGGETYTEGNAIDITNNAISVKYDGITIVQDDVVQDTPIDVSTVTSTSNVVIPIPNEIISLINSNTGDYFEINIPANTLHMYVGVSSPFAYGTLAMDVSIQRYGGSFVHYDETIGVNVTEDLYLGKQTLRLKSSYNHWGGNPLPTDEPPLYLELKIRGYYPSVDSTTLANPIQFAKMIPGNGPLKVSNPLPSNGASGYYLKRTITGCEWAALPEQVRSDWNATSGVSEILNKPTVPNTGNGTIDVSGNVISVKYDTNTLKQLDGANVDFSRGITNNNGAVELSSDWKLRLYSGSGQGVAQIPGMTYTIFNVTSNTNAYLAIFADSSGVYGGQYMYYSATPLTYSNVNGLYYIDAQDISFDFPAIFTNGWAGTINGMYPSHIGIIFTNDSGSSFNMPAIASNSSLFKLGLYQQGAGPLAVKIPIPAFDPVTDIGKVLQVTANGLAWVNP